ncbi:hypothetical protein BDW22DRAFT_1356426 [Trametopsis cervina]|nr:hypothetical protein BDW22DRAFT_1356426 [Trametopsis cervina]
MRRKQPPTKRKPFTATIKKANLSVPLWATCTFTFVLPRPVEAKEPVSRRRVSGGVQIPQELVDYVVDFLHNDARSLVACSLVSHAFVPGSRFHLFATFHIKDDRVLTGLLDGSPYATARHAIRTLCLGSTSVLSNKPPLKLSFASLEALVAQLPLLFNFYMLNISVEFPRRQKTTPVSAPQSSATKAIRYLWLYKVIDADTLRPLLSSQFFSTLRLFTAVETLNFSCGLERRAFWTDPDDAALDQRESSLPVTKVQSLKLCSSTIGTSFLQVIRKSGAARTLRAVEVCAQDRETLVALGELLSEVRHHLVELTVDCRRRNSLHILKDAKGMCQALDISRNLEGASHLQTMTFKLHMSHQDDPLLEWHWQFVLGLIGEVAKVAPAITSCAFVITLAGYYPFKALEAANWQSLDSVLKRMPNLRRIYVGARNSSPFDWSKADQKKTNKALQDVFAGMLPDWKAKSALFPLEQQPANRQFLDANGFCVL